MNDKMTFAPWLERIVPLLPQLQIPGPAGVGWRIILGMLLFGGPVVEAGEWTTWERSLASVRLTDGHFAPDGRLHVLFVEDVTITDSSRLVKLATVQDGSFQVETIEEVGLITDSVIEHGIRLVGDGQGVWAVWRKRLGSGTAAIRAARVYPRAGPLVVETVDSGNSFNRFDACLGADGLPRVAFINSPTYGVTVLRRLAAGTWAARQTLPLTTFGDTAYREIALAGRSGQLDLFLVTSEDPPGGASPPYRSEFTHRAAIEPANWSSLSFGSPQVIESADFDPDNAVAFGLEAAWSGSDTLAVVYGNVAESSGRLATRTGAGPWQKNDFIDFPSGLVRGTDLAVAADGSIHLCWRNALNQLQHVVWNGSSFGPTDELGGISVFDADLEVDRRGVPWFSSRSTDGAKLFVSTPTDTTDEDHDGVIFLLESAFRMNPLVPDREKLPIYQTVEVGGQSYLSYAYLGQGGGTGDNPYVSADFEYHTEVSEDYVNWSTAPADILLTDRFSIAGRGTSSVYRSTSPVGSKSREFIRIRVVRR